MRATHQAGHRFAQNVDHLAHDTPLSAFVAEVVCGLGATPPRTATSPPPNGGNCTNRGATRRRHADGMLLMLQNPHRQRCDALRKGQRARTGPGATCFPMTPPPNGGGNCTNRATTRRREASNGAKPPSPKMRSKTLYPTPDSPHHDDTPVSNDDEFPLTGTSLSAGTHTRLTKCQQHKPNPSSHVDR